MNKIKIIVISLALSLFLPVFVMASDSFPAFPMSFYGTATINGVSMPMGSKIQVYLGSVLQDEIVLTEPGIYGYDDPTRNKLVVGSFSGNLVFKYVLSGATPQAGCLVQEYIGGFLPGTTVIKHLVFSTNCGSNGSNTGGGGGGGGNVTYCSNVVYSSWQECTGTQQFRTILTSVPIACSLTTTQQLETNRVCQTSTSTTTIIDQPITIQNSGVQISNVINVMAEENSLTSKINQDLTRRLSGRILLQVEQKGQAWYLDPVSPKRYYLADGQSAYEALRKFGLGIKNSDINKIPIGQELRFSMIDTDGDGLPDKLEEGIGTNPILVDTDGDGISDGNEVLKNNSNPLGVGILTYSSSLVDRLNGRIVIQTESRGEAWYINPVDSKRYYLANGEAAYQIMRYLSLGISNNDIRKIAVGDWK